MARGVGNNGRGRRAARSCQKFPTNSAGGATLFDYAMAICSGGIRTDTDGL